ncbi:MAG TPA: ABC-F family ATP-binding cassette domain-containing protein [Gemmatimonadales bacterium]|nr:ABC-F family ATP-binding cassette domain-containing protein [Gemmatimonadales bacterium]
MTLLSLSGVAIQYGGEPLLTDITLTVTRGERWGIIGRNGSGKTSLFRIITGDLDPARGAVSRASGLKVAVLDQHRDFAGAGTVWDAACSGFAELLRLEHSLQEQGEAIAARGDRLTQEELNRYDRDLERFRREGGYEMEARVSAVLHGLGFDPDTAKHQPLATLSGGERGRLGLACQLVTAADLLLLDEPTNHLDLETTAWLVDHLKGLDSAALIISHDRAFLDAVADHVLHIEAGTTQAYTGGYSDFVTQREERRLAQGRAWQKQSRMIAKEEDYIARNIAGQNTKQAKGRRRRLSRLPRLSPPPGDESAMAVRFKSGGRGGDQVLVADRLTVSVGDRVLLDRFSGVIRRNDVVALVGPNGTGKTTLLSTLLGQRPAASGSARLGDTVDVNVYRQDLAQVPRDKTLFDIIHDLRPAWTRGQVMDHLGRFDFSGDETLRRAGSLSGGELARVALAMMTLEHVNFLVFDEPTNHLDVESIEALEDAIEAYEGTVLLVSHDRALLNALSTRVWHLEHGTITDYDGNFGEWEEARDARRRQAEAAAREAEAQRRAKEKAAEAKRAPARDGKAQASAQRTARRAADQAEQRVQQLEQEIASRTAALAAPDLYATPDGTARAKALARELEAMKTDLHAAYAAWETAAAEAERLGA